MAISTHGRRPPFAIDANKFTWMVLAALGVLAIGGGASNVYAIQLFWLRPVLILLLAGVLINWRELHFYPSRALFVLLGAFALTIAIQLVPLPGGAAPASIASFSTGGWRPLSLTPDRTWNSLFALLPAALMLIGLSGAGKSVWRAVVPAIVVIALFSAVLGVLQLAVDEGSWLYLYERTSYGLPVGVFANRNHQAAFLASAIPLLWSCAFTWRVGKSPTMLYVVAALMTAFLILTILVTGSRAGLMLICIALPAVIAVAPFRLVFDRSIRRTLIWGGAAASALAMVGVAAILSGRAAAIERFIKLEGGDDGRVERLPALLDLIVNYLPFGSGFGSFDKVFRGIERDAYLRPTFFNNAHNDLIELAITGGVPALIVLVAFLLWLGAQGGRTFLAPSDGEGVPAARAATIAVVMLLCASLFDYPLRTPLCTAVFAALCFVLNQVATHVPVASRSGDS